MYFCVFACAVVSAAGCLPCSLSLSLSLSSSSFSLTRWRSSDPLPEVSDPVLDALRVSEVLVILFLSLSLFLLFPTLFLSLSLSPWRCFSDRLVLLSDPVFDAL